MAVADTANLLVKLSLGGNFLSQIGKATGGLNKFDKKLGQTESRAFKAGQQIGTGIKNAGRLAAVGIGILASQVALGLNSLIELEKQTAQTNAVIKSTGGQAGVTAAQVGRLAEKFESLNATVGDEFIRAGENMLLTFTNIRGKAFEPATKAILDMNTAMGNGPEGLTKTAILVGKALNDPIKGATALRRVGVTLDEQQQKQIKTLVKQNKLYDAQKIILAELNKEFGGSFAAQGNTTAGKVAKFTDSIEDLQRALAEALLPTLGNVADALSKTLADPAVVAGVKEFGKSLAGLISPENISEAGRILQDVFGAARAAAPTIAAAAQTMGKVVGAAVSLFRSLPPEIQSLAVGALAINKLTGGLVTNIAGGLISSVLKQLVSGVVNVNGGVVNVNGVPGGGLGGAAGTAAGVGTGLALGAIGAAVATTVLATQDLLSKTTQQQRIDNGGTRAFNYRPGGVLANQRPPGRGPMPVNRQPVRPVGGATNNRVLLEAILKRGRAAGFSPTMAAAQQTTQRNVARAAAAQKDAAGRLTAAAVAQSRAGDRLSLPLVVPAPMVDITVNVSPAGVIHKYIQIKRAGPVGGSREISNRFGGPEFG